ncbi:MAG: bifunctional riboflavin kinase/FMN adenylyltransferase, partial [Pseudomonadota bacterium]
MKILRDYLYMDASDRGACAAIGNFDGVHLGHQSVIALAQQTVPDAPLGVLTFEPHPRAFFAPDAPPFRLMSPEARASRLEKLGVDYLFEINFNHALAALTPDIFAERVIRDGFGLRHVIVGADFCFGKARSGTADDLASFGAAMGFGVT